MEKFYTINEVTQIFGVTRTTIYEWMNSGRLEYVVIGGRRRFTQKALDAFIKIGGTSTPSEDSSALEDTGELKTPYHAVPELVAVPI